MEGIKELKARFFEIKEAIENGDDDEQQVYDFEETIQEAYGYGFEENEVYQLEKLQKKVKAYKRENGFYDEETELDRMFPDRHEEGFDQDSMNLDSDFGGN